MNKLDMESRNIVNDNIEKLKELFPNAVSEDGINFDELKQELSFALIDEKKEKYQMTWPGKKEAIVESNTLTTYTLRPIYNKSVDFENTKNIYIEGDNLETIKILQESYLNKVKCIYIDPPYNTGNDFIYNDNFSQSNDEELKAAGLIDEEGNRLVSNNSSNGRFHSNWLSMMYSRLKLARNLLKEDGAIFISINDSEYANLKKICDEIFGEKNFVNNFIRKGSGGRQDSKYYAIGHEYILTYAKSIEHFTSGKIIKTDEKYPYYDENLKLKYKLQLLRKWGENSRRSDRPNLYYPIKDPNGEDLYPKFDDGQDSCWRWGKETMMNNIKQGKVEFKMKNNVWIAYEKIFEPKEGEFNTKLYSSIIDDISNNSGASLINSMFDFKIFSYPKPVDLISRVLNLINLSKNDIVMDFFSGSATTAHAVFDYNVRNNKDVRFLLVQIPEKCDEKSDAYKNGYENICEIGEERIKKAGKKIKEDTNANIDYGFRVFKVDSSNMKDVFYKPSDIDQMNLLDYLSNVKEDRAPEDLLIQVMLDLGLTLDLKIEEKTILSNKVFYVEDNSLVACFDEQVDINIIDEICKCNPLKVVFKDISFKTDKDKINLEERIKKLSPETEINIL